jgi:hypothetical protein
MGVGGSGRLIDRLQAHQPHQAANPVAFRHLRIPPQGAEYTLTYWPVSWDLLIPVCLGRGVGSIPTGAIRGAS